MNIPKFLAIAYLFALFCRITSSLPPRTVLIIPAQAETAAISPAIAPKIALQATSTPTAVRVYVLAQATLYGVNPQKALWIIDHESQDCRNQIGDDGQSRGCWQISDIYHPEVSEACADDLQCSTEWTMKRILAGYINDWTTYKFCREWYPDCPY